MRLFNIIVSTLHSPLLVTGITVYFNWVFGQQIRIKKKILQYIQ